MPRFQRSRKRVGRRRLSRRRQTRQRRSRRRIYKQRGGSQAPPLEYTTPGAKITVILSADRRRPTLDMLLQSLQKHKFNYKVVGMGRPWRGFKTKMENLLEGIRTTPSSDLVMILDAYDTIAIKDAVEVYAAYSSRERSQLPIVFTAETICGGNCDTRIREWHAYHRGEEITQREEQATVPGHPFTVFQRPFALNSGGIIGPPNDMKWLFESMLAAPTEDDQLAAGHVTVNNKDKIDLDLQEKIFRLKHLDRSKLPDEGTPNGPAILHFSGMRTEENQAQLLEMFRAYTS